MVLIPGAPPNENPVEAADVAAAPNPPKAGVGAAVGGAAARGEGATAAGDAAVAPPPKLNPPVAGAAENDCSKRICANLITGGTPESLPTKFSPMPVYMVTLHIVMRTAFVQHI